MSTVQKAVHKKYFLLMDTSQHVAVTNILLDSPVGTPPANRPAC